MNGTITVSAVLITDPDGRALVVRKAGTAHFMQPGGKPEPGEAPAEAAARELGEELGILVSAEALRPLGRHHTMAANEPGFALVADAYALELDGAAAAAVVPHAEIAEIRWLTPADLVPAATVPLAPLSLEVLLPLAWPQHHG